MNRIMYKGYEIHAVPLPLATGEWAKTLYIGMSRNGGMSKRAFTGGGTCQTKEEAIRASLATGKKKIDGQRPRS